MGRVDDIPVHTQATAISQVADSDRYVVHAWSARCADNQRPWYMLVVCSFALAREFIGAHVCAGFLK